MTFSLLRLFRVLPGATILGTVRDEQGEILAPTGYRRFTARDGYFTSSTFTPAVLAEPLT
jgi:hypothetical protein